MFVRLHKPLPSQYFVSVNSDLFLGSESAVSMPFVDLALPQEEETVSKPSPCLPSAPVLAE